MKVVTIIFTLLSSAMWATAAVGLVRDKNWGGVVIGVVVAVVGVISMSYLLNL
jgi:predicted small integral membrane protein